VGFNPLANISPERHALAASGMVSAFKHLWRESWGPHGWSTSCSTASWRCWLRRALRGSILRASYTDENSAPSLIARLRDPIKPSAFGIGSTRSI